MAEDWPAGYAPLSADFPPGYEPFDPSKSFPPGFAQATPQSGIGHRAGVVATGVNSGIAGVVGAPVDLATAGINAASRGVDWLANKAGHEGPVLGQINDPFGGSQSVERGIGSVVGKTPIQDQADAYLYSGGRGLGGAAAGIASGDALNSAEILPLVAKALGGGADTLRQAVTNLLAGTGAGVGSLGGRDVVSKFTDSPLAQAAGTAAGGLAGGLAAGYAPTAAQSLFERYTAPTDTRAMAAIRDAFNKGVKGGAANAQATQYKLGQSDATAAGLTPKPLALADVENEPLQALGERVAQTPGTGAQTARDFLSQRDAAAGPRLLTDLNESLGAGPSAYRTAQSLAQQRATDAAPLYQKAFEGGSIAPLEDTITKAFNQASSSSQQAARDVATAQQAVTAAAAKDATAGNVYSSSAAATAGKDAATQLAQAQQRLAVAEQSKAQTLDLLRTAQEHAAGGVPGAVWTPRIQQFLDDPIIQQGINKGVQVQRLESLASGQPFDPREFAITGFDQAGSPIVSKVPNMRLLDAAKRGLDDILEQYRDPTTGTLRLDQYGRAVDQVRQSFLGELDRVNPDYAAARAAWSGPSQTMSAMKQGANIFNMQPEQISDVIGRLAPADKPFFQIGARDALSQRIAKTSAGGNESLRIVGNQQVQNQLRPLFDSDNQFNAFINQAKLESLMYGTRARMLGNSATFRRLAATGEGGSSPGMASNMMTAGGAALTGEPIVAANHAARAVAQMLSSMGGLTPSVRAAIAQKMFTSDPGALGQTLGGLSPQQRGAPFGLAPTLGIENLLPLLPGERPRY